MDQFGPQMQEIDTAGALACIAAQKRSSLIHLPNGDPVAFFRSHPVAAPCLLDEDRHVTRAYGVYKAFGVDSINIARPATFVIGRDQRIRFIYVGSNQADRAPLEQVVQAFRNASKEK